MRITVCVLMEELVDSVSLIELEMVQQPPLLQETYLSPSKREMRLLLQLPVQGSNIVGEARKKKELLILLPLLLSHLSVVRVEAFRLLRDLLQS